MTGITVDMSQVNALAATFAVTSGRVGGLAAAALRRTAFAIEADAKSGCPVDTGFLRGSISTTVTGDGRTGSMAAEIGPTAEYGGYVELGTSRMSPQPYLAPAFDRRAPELESALLALPVL